MTGLKVRSVNVNVESVDARRNRPVARRKARELAFRTLFQSERGGTPVLEVWRQVREEALEEPEPEADAAYGEGLDTPALDFAQTLVRAYAEHRDEVDGELSELVSGWSFGQMAQTDLNVLRLAVTEMRYGPAWPPGSCDRDGGPARQEVRRRGVRALRQRCAGQAVPAPGRRTSMR